MNKTCNRCGKEAHHIHHKDGNHRNNAEENLEILCTLCHAGEHGIEPKISELKRIVTLYHKVQKSRVALSNSTKSYQRIELVVPDKVLKAQESLEKMEKEYRKELSQYFKENPSKIYDWLVSIKGISDILVGKLLSEIDFTNTPSVESLWAYAGLAPKQVKETGKKSNWNHRLKMYCFQVANSFIKQKTERYKRVYDKEKERQIDNGIKRGHAHNRALRKIEKLFLRDLYKKGMSRATTF